MKSIPFMLIFFLVPVCGEDSPYLLISVFEESTCSRSSLVTQWVYPVHPDENECLFTGPCNSHQYLPYPEGMYSMGFGVFTINTTSNIVSFKGFRYTCGETYGSLVHENEYNAYSCIDFHSGFKVNFSLSTTNPFDYENRSQVYMVEQVFKDDGCADETTSSSFATKSSILSMEFSTSGVSICTDGYFGVILGDPSNGFNIFPLDVAEGRCDSKNNIENVSVLWSSRNSYDYHSMRCYCMSEEDTETQYLTRMWNAKSSSEYLMEYTVFEHDCEYQEEDVDFHSRDVLIYYLDACVDFGGSGQTITKTEENRFYMYSYDMICFEDEIWRFYDTYYPESMCFFPTEADNVIFPDDSDEPVIQYRRISLSDDPYFPKLMGFFQFYQSDVCDYTGTVSKIQEVPSLAFITYFDNENCLDLRNITGLVGLSHRGYCEDGGHLRIRSFFDSSYCVGAYIDQDFEEGLCDVVTYGDVTSSVYYVCIPRFCDGISEYDVDEVCSGGKGVCVENNLCECDDGFSGNICQTWKCNGLEKDEKSVCSENGVCESPDNCVCNFGFSGIDCSRDSIALFFSIFGPISGFVLSSIIICICCCCFGCCVCILISAILSASLVSLVAGVNVVQKKRLEKFNQLEDFEVLLKEQLLDHKSDARLKIDKSLYEINFDEVVMEKLIGSGGSGAKVYRSKWKGEVVAFKLFKTMEMFSSDGDFSNFEQEVKLLASLSHPSIVTFFGACLKKPRVGIVMEFCENGEVLEFLLKYKETNGHMYPFKEKLRMCMEMIGACEFIHSRKIIHRDIKPENILVNGAERCKLMDFGFSKLIENENDYKTKQVGTNQFMAPEVLVSDYDHKCDVFSFSILLWMMFSEDSKPYGEHFKGEYTVANDHSYRPDLEKILIVDVGQEDGEVMNADWIIDVMVKCWSHEPSERYEFSDLSTIFEEEKKKLEL